MSFAEAVHSLERIVHQISAVLNRVGTYIILVMMLLTTTDVVLRYIFNQPIKGAYEYTQFMMLIVVALGLAFTQSRKGHVFIELVASRFPPRAQALNDAIVYLVCLGACVLIAWQAVAGGQTQQMGNVVASDVVRVPLYPFYYVLAFGVAALGLVYMADILDSARRLLKK